MGEASRQSLCVLCREPITVSNNSREHIIPAAIGGHDRVRSFICVSCNSTKGDAWEAELAAQTNWFSVALNIRREKGEAPRQKLTTIGGVRYWLSANGAMESGEPPVQKSITERGKQFRFTFPNMEMARKKVHEIARKYPQVDPEKVLSTAQTQIQFVEEPVKITFQLTEGSMRSIVKTALAFAFHIGIPVDACEAATQYLRSDEGDIVWTPFYERELVTNRPARQVTHSVTVCANPGDKAVLAYVEYFSAFRYVVRLSGNYRGPAMQKTMAFDPVSWQPVKLIVDLALSADEYARTVERTTWSFENMKQAFEYSMPIALAALNKRRFDYGIRQAICDGFEAMGVKPGGFLPPEKFQEFSAYVSQRVVRCIVRPRQRFNPSL